MAKALVDIHTKESEINVLSLHDANNDFDNRYLNRSQFKGFGGNTLAFISHAALKGFTAHKLILSHVHLLPVAILIKTISPRTKIVLLAHGIEVWRELKTWEKRFMRASCEVWAVSQFTAAELQEKHKIPETNLRVLNNCLDPYFKIPKIKDRPNELVYKHGILPSDPILFTLTRLSSTELYKGYDLVLQILPEIIKSHPTLLYIIAGKAHESEQRRLERLIEDLNLQNNVVLLGFIPEDRVTSYFKLADVFIMPSQKEGFGLVFIEAAACGTKVIAGNKDGSRDALLDGKLGTLVNPENKAHLAAAIFELLSDSKNSNTSAIQQLCLQNFSYSQYKNRVAAFLSPRSLSQANRINAQKRYEIVPAP